MLYFDLPVLSILFASDCFLSALFPSTGIEFVCFFVFFFI